jgi:hypothetical protein
MILLTDGFCRDPDTGRRGVAVRPAMIRKLRCQWGGAQPGGGTAPAGGEVELFLLPTNRVAPYGPSAQLDDTVNTGGFSSGYNSSSQTIRCYAHKYSESSEAVDVSHFATGNKIRIVEMDPANPAAPDSWDRIASNVSSNDIVLDSALSSPAFDSGKRYRVIFDDYGDAVTLQRTKCYQADDADGRIVDDRPPFQYGAGGSRLPYSGTAPAVELPPDTASGDGVSLDVGHQQALAYLLENLLRFKMARSSPFLYSDELSGAGATGTYRLVEMCPIHLSYELLANARRSLNVAPMIKSSDGALASIRVSLVPTPPTDNTIDDIDLGNVVNSVVFTTTSTTYSTPTPQPLDITSVKGKNGVAYLLIELNAKARSWGLAYCQESEPA